MTSQKGAISLLLIGLIAGAAVILGLATFIAATQKEVTLTDIFNAPNQTACTQEAMQCSDGSYVGRSGPNCEFAKCPTQNIICAQDVRQCTNGLYVNRIAPNCDFAICPQENLNEKQITLQEGQRQGPLLIQKIYPTYITGLNFAEYPVATGQGRPITLYVGQTASNGCTITLTLVSIQNNTATFTEKTDFSKPCPICLAENTLIDTPNGVIPVQNLQAGMAVWTVDALGQRVAGTIIKTSKTPVPATHQMVHIILGDKREIFASPGHPIGDGRIFNDLLVDDILDGSPVIVAEKTSYDKGYTYDILPSGNTGLYFANGILIDSTLH